MAASTGSSTFDFVKLPKIELHAHLSGSISPQCLHEIWLKDEAKKSSLPDPLVELGSSASFDIETFFPVFGKFIYALIDSEETIRYSTRRVLEDFEADGVVYLELRTGPRAYPARSITKDDYVRIILETIAAYHSDRMVTKLILALDRKYSTIEQADEIANLTIKYAPQGVVGLDICGDPSAGDVSIFAPAFTKIREAGLHVTLHFGEVPNSGTVEELNALLSFQPERIGHVIYLPEEIQEEVKRRKLGLELCLSSNVKLKMISGTYSDHHFDFWRHTECPIVLCTDDVGVLGSPLSNEYALIAEHFHLNEGQIRELARGGIDRTFGGEEQKKRLRDLMK